MLLSSCVSKYKDVDIKTDNHTILNISQKLEDGTITYEDIFESDYGIYAERTADTRDVLNQLVSKAYYFSLKNKNNNGAIKIDFSKIFEDNKDKIVDRILDEKNLKYSIYPSNGGEQWFANDDSVKAPFNFFQQNIVFLVDKDTLERISILLFDKLAKTEKTFKLNFGTLWVLYGNGHELEKLFSIMCDYVSMCEKKIKDGKKLTKQNYRVISEMRQFDEFKNVKPGDFTEYIAKKIMMDKVGDLLKRVNAVFSSAKVE